VTVGHWRPAYIGVGSNLESPQEQVRSGIAALGKIPDTRLLLQSSLYRSPPMCGADQPDYINAVATVLTGLDPQELLEQLQRIEDSHGRVRTAERWGPRTLDLDLLAYAGLIVESERLTVPHPGIAERNFVLFPWREIAPHFEVPGLSTVARLAGRVTNEPGIERLN
jgi:2-amino-4-hydroxy-6-hydroxymethyldihydropteridine diphosphokinase